MIVQEIESQKCSVLVVVDEKNGTEFSEVLNYLQTHSEKKNVLGIRSLFSNYAKDGTDGLTENQFHPAKNTDPNIYRFGKGKVRVYCFQDGDDVIVTTHGAQKKSQETTKADMDQANAVRDAYFEAKNSGTLEVRVRPKK